MSGSNRSRRLGAATAAALVLLLIAACNDDSAARTETTSSTTEPPASASASAPNCGKADITEDDAGRRVSVGPKTSRFSICLNENEHPLRDLKADGCPFVYVSNLSLNGPDNYPIGFEVLRSGSCVVTNREYEVEIVTSA